MSSIQYQLGLALSGGGYRAAAFHLGTLKKLHELNILSKVDVFSTISGGSITGAAWCLCENDFDTFYKEMREGLITKNVIRYVLGSWVFWRTIFVFLILVGGALVLSFTQWSAFTFPLLIIFFLILFKYQFILFPVSKVIENAYDDFFFKGKTLKDLKDRPVLAIGSSNLHSGRPFTFSKKEMSDSSYSFRTDFAAPIKFEAKTFPVARAVTASSCVPFAFTPVTISKEYFVTPADFDRVKPVLVDGGVYDNQGIHKLTQPNSSYECGNTIISDAGGNFVDDNKYTNTLSLLLRTVDLFMYRIKAAQMVQNIYRNVEGAGKPIAYFSLGWRIYNAIPGFFHNMCDGKVIPQVLDHHDFLPEWKAEPEKYEKEIVTHMELRVGYEAIRQRDLTEEQWRLAKNTGTNLTNLSHEQVDHLIRQAENFTELQIKLYCPQLI